MAARSKIQRKATSGYAQQAEAQLLHFFQRNGYVRVPSPDRKEEDPDYKKGYEVRLVLNSSIELAQVEWLLKQVDLKPGKPFQKHSRFVQPIYGKHAVNWFLALNRQAKKEAKSKKEIKDKKEAGSKKRKSTVKTTVRKRSAA